MFRFVFNARAFTYSSTLALLVIYCLVLSCPFASKLDNAKTKYPTSIQARTTIAIISRSFLSCCRFFLQYFTNPKFRSALPKTVGITGSANSIVHVSLLVLHSTHTHTVARAPMHSVYGHSIIYFTVRTCFA